MGEEKMLRIAVPEDLNDMQVFEKTLSCYTKEHELLSMKTSQMGSIFKLTYRIKMKNENEQKEMIDELRQKNGNLEINIEPFAETSVPSL